MHKSNKADVFLPCAKTFGDYDESVKEFLNIEEGEQGEDIVTFVCTACGHRHKSRVYTRR